MPWCPNCREEYRPGFKACIDCGAELVEELPAAEHDAAAETNGVCEAYLTTTADWPEAEVMEACLKAAGIPAMKVADGSGVNIFVPQRLVEQAQGIADGVREMAKDGGRRRAGRKGAGEDSRMGRESRRPAPAGDSMWCPKCRMEYRRGFTRCGDCGVELVDSLPDVDVDDEAEESGDEIIPFCDAFLLKAANRSEAALLESQLNDDGIPVAIVARGSGADIYVPEELLDAAWDVVGSVRGTGGDDGRTGEEEAGPQEPAPPAAGGSGRLWCPNCRVEYWQEGVAVCSDCGARLVDPATGPGKRGHS